MILTTATVKVYELKPGRYNKQGDPIRPGWWWSVTIGHECARAWAPSQRDAWAGALAELSNRSKSYA